MRMSWQGLAEFALSLTHYRMYQISPAVVRDNESKLFELLKYCSKIIYFLITSNFFFYHNVFKTCLLLMR